MNATTKPALTVEQYRAALRIAGIDRDSVIGCQERSSHDGWDIIVSLHGTRNYYLTPDGRYSPR